MPPAASKMTGMALVWRGGDLCRGKSCFEGEWEARDELRRRFLLKGTEGLRGRRPWESKRLWREGEREYERDGWSGIGV